MMTGSTPAASVSTTGDWIGHEDGVEFIGNGKIGRDVGNSQRDKAVVGNWRATLSSQLPTLRFRQSDDGRTWQSDDAVKLSQAREARPPSPPTVTIATWIFTLGSWSSLTSPNSRLVTRTTPYALLPSTSA